MSLEKLVELHLKPSETLSERRLITSCAAFFIKEVSAYLDTESGETFYDLPYSRITEIIFKSDTTSLNKSELDDLKGVVEERIRENLSKNGIPDDIKEIVDKTKRAEQESLEETCTKHLSACYRKFVSHIGLAGIQKVYILDNINFANQQVNKLNEQLQEANETITEMVANVESAYNLAESGSRDAQLALNAALEAKNEVEKTAHLASDGSRRAQEAISSAEEIKVAVEDNNKFAQQALDEAKQVKQETNDLTIQFITILGIFATIIITVFGGISVVKAASELLSSGRTSIILVSFTVGILMCSLISLVILLTSWINSVQSKDYKKLDGAY